MTIAAATVTFGPDGPALDPAAPLPLGALLIGRPVAEVADLLPRIFNLCAAAQGIAARLCLGLPVMADPGPEIIRDHRLRLGVILPRAFGLDPQPQVLPLGPLPHDPAAIDLPLFTTVARLFPPGAAVTAPLPVPADPLAPGAFENSAAGRQSAHPLLRRIESTHGRGPLWRLAGLLADLTAAEQGRLPPARLRDGTATAPAARGTYALRLTHAGGLVTGITRRTPTDHLLAPGGALLQALGSLPSDLSHLAPQVIALHDPCIPVTLRPGASHATAPQVQHA